MHILNIHIISTYKFKWLFVCARSLLHGAIFKNKLHNFCFDCCFASSNEQNQSKAKKRNEKSQCQKTRVHALNATP